MTRQAWAHLTRKNVRSAEWVVSGGSLDGLAHFFRGATEEQLARMVDVRRSRFVRTDEPIRIGARVTIDEAGKVAWRVAGGRGQGVINWPPYALVRDPKYGDLIAYTLQVTPRRRR